MNLGLDGRRALVTAASRGLGRACAEALIVEGARVFVSSSNAEAITATAREIGAAGHHAANMAEARDVEALAQAAMRELGGLDILVVNAGGPPPGNFESTTEEKWLYAWNLTLMSAVRLIRAVLPALRESEQGRIVTITSALVKEPDPNIILSNAYRAAVTGMAKTLSKEVAPHGVTVNNIAPESILTERLRQLRNLHSDEDVARAAKDHPLRRLGEASELGALCAFLCSKQAGYLNGQTIVLDGGASSSLL